VRLVSGVLAGLVVVVAGAALLVGLVVPRLAGATPYTVTSASMAPALPVGSLVVVRPRDTVALGDVITYQQRSGSAPVVTHRVVGVGVSPDGRLAYTTRGDANGADDANLVRPEQVRGVVWYHVPHLGRLSALVSGPQRQTVATGIAAVLVGYALWQLVQIRRDRTAATQTAGAPGPVLDAGPPGRDRPAHRYEPSSGQEAAVERSAS
jgi:signal peptidase